MGAVVSLLLWAVGLFVLYWVVRAAVKGGILDADRLLAQERRQAVRLAVTDALDDAGGARRQ